MCKQNQKATEYQVKGHQKEERRVTVYGRFGLVWFNVEGEGQILFFKIPKKRGHCTVVVVVVTTFKDRNQKTKQKKTVQPGVCMRWWWSTFLEKILIIIIIETETKKKRKYKDNLYVMDSNGFFFITTFTHTQKDYFDYSFV